MMIKQVRLKAKPMIFTNVYVRKRNKGRMASISSFMVNVLFQNQFFRVAKSTVSGDNNLIASLQSAGNLILLRVLSADADVYFAGFCPGLVQLIDPLAAGRLEEVARGMTSASSGCPSSTCTRKLFPMRTFSGDSSVKTRSTSKLRSFTSGTTLVMRSGYFFPCQVMVAGRPVVIRSI